MDPAFARRRFAVSPLKDSMTGAAVNDTLEQDGKRFAQQNLFSKWRLKPKRSSDTVTKAWKNQKAQFNGQINDIQADDSRSEALTESVRSDSIGFDTEDNSFFDSRDEAVLESELASLPAYEPASPVKKTVSFGGVSVHLHGRMLGDNPAVS